MLTIAQFQDNRPLYPGELDLSLGSGSSDDFVTSRPGGVSIQVQHYTGTDDATPPVWNKPNYDGHWGLRVKNGEPVMIGLQETGPDGMTTAFLDSQLPGLHALVGAPLCAELTTYFWEMVTAFKSGDQWSQRRVEFANPAAYNDLIFALECKAHRSRQRSRDARVTSLRNLLKAWNNTNYGAQMAWYAERPDRADEAARLTALLVRHVAATEAQLTALGAGSGRG